MGVAVGRAVRTSIVAINVIDLFLSHGHLGHHDHGQAGGLSGEPRSDEPPAPRRASSSACCVLGVWLVNADLHPEVHLLRRGHAEDRHDRPAAARAGRRQGPRRDRRRGASACEPTRDGAELTLGIKPDQIDTIPRNVTASILPKTLFGEKYVELEDPRRTPAPPSLQAGDTITRPRCRSRSSRSSTTSTRCCAPCSRPSSTTPSTRWRPPSRAAATRSAQNLETLDGYLKRMNPQMPALIEDLRLLAKVTDTYADVMPAARRDPAQHREDRQHARGREAKLNAFLKDVAAFSDTATTLPGRTTATTSSGSASSASRSSRCSRATPPEFPCLLGGIVDAGAAAGRHVPRLHLPHQPRDDPATSRAATRRPTARSTAPTAAQLRRPAQPAGARTTRAAPARTSTTASTSPPARAPTAARPSAGHASWRRLRRRPGRGALLNSLIGPALGIPADQMPDLPRCCSVRWRAGRR